VRFIKKSTHTIEVKEKGEGEIVMIGIQVIAFEMISWNFLYHFLLGKSLYIFEDRRI
jgi:hypothetical protein